MSANLDTSNGRINMAFIGDRNDIWHRQGKQKEPGQSIESWAQDAGMKWHVEPHQAFVTLPDGTVIQTPWYAGIRSDTKHPLGIASERRVEHQPQDFLEFMAQYCEADPRFQMDTAGCIDGGRRIWANARFTDDITVGGDKHRLYLLGGTAFDGTLATFLQGSSLRTVCDNTMRMNIGLTNIPRIRLRHNTRFDKERLGRELATVVKGFDVFKCMGDAMALKHVDEQQLKCLFKHVLEIPWDTPVKDVSTRKVNQYTRLWEAYATTAQETEQGTAWCALNAVTRYVDHDRDVRGSDGTDAGLASQRFASANFGPGMAVKEKALAFLSDDDLLRAVAQRTADVNDVSAMLKQTFRSSFDS